MTTIGPRLLTEVECLDLTKMMKFILRRMEEIRKSLRNIFTALSAAHDKTEFYFIAFTVNLTEG